MTGTGWINLLRRIPASYHDCLILMTSIGGEIVIQRLIRLDRDFLVALGRVSGTTDGAKLVVIPYSQMTYLTFNKKMTDEEMLGIVGTASAAAVAVEPEPAAAPAPAAVAAASEPAEEFEVINFAPAAATAAAVEETPPPTPAEAAATTAKANGKAAPPSKTVLLARLRERLAHEVAKPSGG